MDEAWGVGEWCSYRENGRPFVTPEEELWHDLETWWFKEEWADLELWREFYELGWP